MMPATAVTVTTTAVPPTAVPITTAAMPATATTAMIVSE
jgi:hypothetical protein